MRVVVYDDEMEPITVLNLRGLTPRDIVERGMVWRIAVPEPIKITYEPEADISLAKAPIATLRFERLIRKGVEHLMCFTTDDEIVLRADPDWLPGQRGEVNRILRENAVLTNAFMRAFLG